MEVLQNWKFKDSGNEAGMVEALWQWRFCSSGGPEIVSVRVDVLQ